MRFLQCSIRLPASVRSGCDAVYLRVEHKKTRDQWLIAEAFLQRNAEQFFELRNQRPRWQLSNYACDFSILWPGVACPPASTGKISSFLSVCRGFHSRFASRQRHQMKWSAGWMVGCLLHNTSDAPVNERHVEWNVGEVFAASEESLNEIWEEVKGYRTKHEQSEGGFGIVFEL